MERKVGGGIGMGKTCKLKAFSFQCMTKFTTKKKKVKKKKEIKEINIQNNNRFKKIKTKRGWDEIKFYKTTKAQQEEELYNNLKRKVTGGETQKLCQ